MLILDGDELPELADFFFLMGLTGGSLDSLKSSTDVTDPIEMELDLVSRNCKDRKEFNFQRHIINVNFVKKFKKRLE